MIDRKLGFCPEYRHGKTWRLRERNKRATVVGLGGLIVCGALVEFAVAGWAQQQTPLPFDPPLNQLQFIGTHNSYHIAPSAKLRHFIEGVAPGQGEVLNYTHRPLSEQLDRGIRQLELDIYGDPEGGLYADPLGPRLVGEVAQNDDVVMKKPGFKILHSPDFDVNTTVPTLSLALRQLHTWSLAHPNHEPIMVLLELEQDSFSPRIQPPSFDDADALLALEGEIRASLSPTEVLTPDEVQGISPTLRDAVLTHGWPRLSKTRGKFIFTLDNEGAVSERYLALSPHKDLQGRVCFVSVPPTHPAAAWMKRNEPDAQFEDIRALVRAGFMVRTRADTDLKEVLAHDRSRFDKAASSGAQWISTDAPETDPRWPNFFIGWPDHAPFRLNPLFQGKETLLP